MKLLKMEQDWIGKEFLIKEAMTRMPYTISAESEVSQARELMKQYRIRHLPVLKGGELVGVVCERDIRTAETFHGPGYLTVGDAMTHAPFSVGPNVPLADVLSQLLKNNLECAVIKSPRGVVIGIFTASDALDLLRALVLLGNRDSMPEAQVDFGAEVFEKRAA